jgi:antitoxin MazE
MPVKLARWGNSIAVRIPRDALFTAGFTEGQDLELNTKCGALELVLPGPRYTLAELVDEMKQVAPKDRPALEDWGILPSEWPLEDWSDVAPNDIDESQDDLRARIS